MNGTGKHESAEQRSVQRASDLRTGRLAVDSDRERSDMAQGLAVVKHYLVTGTCLFCGKHLAKSGDINWLVKHVETRHA
jgi:hypothetical protein